MDWKLEFKAFGDDLSGEFAYLMVNEAFLEPSTYVSRRLKSHLGGASEWGGGDLDKYLSSTEWQIPETEKPSRDSTQKSQVNSLPPLRCFCFTCKRVCFVQLCIMTRRVSKLISESIIIVLKFTCFALGGRETLMTNKELLELSDNDVVEITSDLREWVWKSDSFLEN